MEQRSATVQAFIYRQGDSEIKILLVHEKDEGVPIEDPDGINRTKHGKKSKPAGWALPGGGVEPGPSIGALIGKLIEFVCFYRIATNQEDARLELSKAIPENTESEYEARLILELVRECLLETGFLIRPVRQLFDHANDSGHTVYVFYGQVVAGQLQQRSVETDDCRWFGLSELPDGLFHSHAARISRVASILGVNAGGEETGGIL